MALMSLKKLNCEKKVKSNEYFKDQDLAGWGALSAVHLPKAEREQRVNDKDLMLN